MKKRIALCMALVMLLTMFCFPASAAETVGAAASPDSAFASLINLGMEDTQYPTIMLPGINHSKYYILDENGEPKLDGDGKRLESGLLIIDSTTVVGDAVKGLLMPLLSTIITQHDMGLSDAIYDLACNVLKYTGSNENGEPAYPIGLYDYQQPVSLWSEDDQAWFYRMMPMEAYTSIPYASGVAGGNNTLEDMTYLCTFPLLGNPMESAEKLRSMVDRLAAEYGKVNLCAVSLGGTLLTAYLDMIPQADYAKLNGIIGFVAALDGTSIMADFMNRDWCITDEMLYNSFFPYMMNELEGDKTIGYLINIAIRLFPKDVLYSIFSSAFEGILDTVLINNPQLWALLPKADYDRTAARYLAEDSILKAKTDRFQQARLHLNSNLLVAANEYGVSVNTISGYNRRFDEGEYCFFGLIKSVNTSSDSVLDVASTSLGVTAAAPRQKIKAAGLYTESSVLTPDGCLDISTCLFPQNAWFFKGQHHEIGRNDVAAELAACLITGALTNVNDMPSVFPQVNGNRDMRTVVRPGGYMDKAAEVLSAAEGTYTEEQLAAVREAHEFGQSVMDNTLCNPDEAQEAYDRLNDALVLCGVNGAPAEKTPLDDFLLRTLNNISDRQWAIRGAAGFWELPNIPKDAA